MVNIILDFDEELVNRREINFNQTYPSIIRCSRRQRRCLLFAGVQKHFVHRCRNRVELNNLKHQSLPRLYGLNNNGTLPQSVPDKKSTERTHTRVSAGNNPIATRTSKHSRALHAPKISIRIDSPTNRQIDRVLFLCSIVIFKKSNRMRVDLFTRARWRDQRGEHLIRKKLWHKTLKRAQREPNERNEITNFSICLSSHAERLI